MVPVLIARLNREVSESLQAVRLYARMYTACLASEFTGSRCFKIVMYCNVVSRTLSSLFQTSVKASVNI